MKVRQIFFYIFIVLAIGINVFIIVEGALNGSQSEEQSMGLTYAFINFIKIFNPNTTLENDLPTVHYVIRKLFGHFVLFGISGLITTGAFILSKDMMKKHKAIILVASGFIGLFVAFVSEFMQLLTPGRVFSFADTMIDFAGYVGFGGLLFLICYLICRTKEKKELEKQN